MSSSSVMSPGWPTIKLPEAPTLQGQLQKKRQIYKERLVLYPPESPKWQDALCKKRLLDMILERGEVKITEFATTIVNELANAMTMDEDSLSKLIIRAWGVIGDYCQTGGQNVDKLLPE